MSDTAEKLNVTELQVQPANSFSLTPKDLDEAMKFSEMIASSDICPKDFKGKPGNVLVAVQMGLELGLPPIQAIQNIAVINGRPSVWGDATPALAKAHPKFEHLHEEFDEASYTAICRIKRKGEGEQTRTFSKADAQTAGLWGKQGPWTNYPKRMCQMRARAFAIRDVFPDALKGIQVAEEVMDYPKEMGTADRVDTNTGEITKTVDAELLPDYPQDQFDEKYPAWEKLIKSGKKPVQNVIATVESMYTLTTKQKDKLLAIKIENSN